jgi:hypothetical protein
LTADFFLNSLQFLVVQMSKAIVSVKNFNPTNISFAPIKRLDSGGSQVYMNYNYDASTRKNLTVQVGTLPVPYGLNVFDKAGPIKYSVDISLRGYDDNAKVKQVYDFFNQLDEFMIDQGVANSKQWFKSSLTRDVVKAFYTPTLRWAKDADGNVKPYPPTVKLQLRQREGKFDVELYDENRNELKGVRLEDVLVKGAQVTALIQATSVWFAGSKFGISWKALQIRMDKIPDSIRGYSIQDEDDDGVVHAPARRVPAPTYAQAPVAAAAAAAAAASNKFGPLEDEEEDEEVEEERAFVPAPAAASRSVAKPSVMSAVMPSAPAPVTAFEDEDADDVEPVALPKKATVTKKAIVKKVVGK